jgi:hypothetical protein
VAEVALTPHDALYNALSLGESVGLLARANILLTAQNPTRPVIRGVRFSDRWAGQNGVGSQGLPGGCVRTVQRPKERETREASIPASTRR